MIAILPTFARNSYFTVFCCCISLLSLSKASAQSGTDLSRLGIVGIEPTHGPRVAIDRGFMVPYKEKIPGTEVEFEMIPIPGGVVRFVFSDPESSQEESRLLTVAIEPLWVGKTEVTWQEFYPYTRTYDIFKQRSLPIRRAVNDANRKDAITSPTPIYEPRHIMEYGAEPNHPAVTMTPYAAKQYTKWLSKFIGRQYRIPTEAEWEYFSRAGTDTQYSFGDDSTLLHEYACYEQNNRNGPNLVGSKKPNAFGLFDVHGSVWEWVIDGYAPQGNRNLGTDTKNFWEAIQWPTQVDKRIAKGGSFMEPAERCTIRGKIWSDDDDWKDSDPDAPPSPWWFTSDPSRSVGMRVVRSLSPLPDEQIERFWEADHPDIVRDVSIRLKEGRGAIGIAVPELAQDLMRALERKKDKQ